MRFITTRVYRHHGTSPAQIQPVNFTNQGIDLQVSIMHRSSTMHSYKPRLLNDRSAPIYPLTITEAVLYTSTREPPSRVLPYQPATSPQSKPPTNPLRLVLPYHRDPPPVTATTDSTSKSPVLPPLPNQPQSQGHNLLTLPATYLPHPVPPPALTATQLATLPSNVHIKLANQRAYAALFNALERDGGWLWWEKKFIDIERVEADFGAVLKFGIGIDGEVEVVVDDDNDGDGGEGNGDEGERNVLGEEEEEVPEHEKLRTENNKRIAAYVTRCLILGLVE